MSEQMQNSIPNVENTSVSPNIGNTMLSASAVLSAEQVSELCKDFFLDCQKTDKIIHVSLNVDNSVVLPNRVLTVIDLDFLNLINRRFIDTDKKPRIKINYAIG